MFSLMLTMALTPSVCDVVRERPFVATDEWAESNLIMPRESDENPNGLMRLDRFPHAREVMEEFDNPDVDEITLQWASRLGKTQTFMACLCKQIANRPCPMAWGEPDEHSLKRVFRRMYEMMDNTPALRKQLPPPHKRTETTMNLVDCLIHGAWSGSYSTASDYSAAVVVLNEFSKMSKAKSDEADWPRFMRERTKGCKRRKILQSSTPSFRGRCRIESARLSGDNRARLVPCPFCNHFQTLREHDGKRPGGLKSDDYHNPQIALETAWYECERCLRKILDGHRDEMMQAGVWVPEGMSVTGSGRLTGKKAKPGTHASFGPLSTLYSLVRSVSWGYIAKESADSRMQDPNGLIDWRTKRRNFVNGWLSETWDDAPTKLAGNELAMRLCIPGQSLRVCPVWSKFLTRGVDVGSDDGRKLFWCVVYGWGDFGRGGLVDKYLMSEMELKAELLANKPYEHADGSTPLRPAITLIDSSAMTDDIYQFCRQFRAVLPLKGSSTSGFPTTFRLSGIEEAPTAMKKELQARLGGLVLLEVNTERTNNWIEDALYSPDHTPDKPFGLSLPEDLAMDESFLDQLTNEYPVDERDKNGYTVRSWKKRGGNNEWRDATRYAYVGAMYMTNHGQQFSRLPIRLSRKEWEDRQRAQALAQKRAGGRMTSEDGRAWLATDR